MVALQYGFFGIFANLHAFLVLFIIFGGIIGFLSRKLSIGVYGAILTYVYVAINTSLFIFDAILYLVLFIILLWASSFVVSAYFESNTEET